MFLLIKLPFSSFHKYEIELQIQGFYIVMRLETRIKERDHVENTKRLQEWWHSHLMGYRAAITNYFDEFIRT